MARINFEESIFKDLRFVKLVMKKGDLDAAVGCVVRAWTLAQKWYLKDDRRVPIEEWNKQEISPLLFEVGLAEVSNGRVRVAGADEQFGWLLQKVEAGRKGGRAKANRAVAGAKHSQAGPKPLTLSLTLPLSSSSSSSSSSKEKTGEWGGKANFERAASEYLAIPGTMRGQKAAERFATQVRDEKTLGEMLQAIRNYREFLRRPENSYRLAKTTFEIFLGTKRSGFFWRDFISLPAPLPPQANTRPGFNSQPQPPRRMTDEERKQIEADEAERKREYEKLRAQSDAEWEKSMQGEP